MNSSTHKQGSGVSFVRICCGNALQLELRNVQLENL
jgi:hypothetical protein